MRSVGRGWLALALIVGSGGMAQADSLKVLHRFADTGSSASRYALGATPEAELLQASDANFYGTTLSGGSALCPNGDAGMSGVMTILQALSTCSQPTSALIFGADGKLYGTTTSGGGDGGCIFSLNTDGTGFDVRYSFDANGNAPGEPQAGLVLARDGMMYGTTHFGSLERGYGQDNGVVYRFDPVRARSRPWPISPRRRETYQTPP